MFDFTVDQLLDKVKEIAKARPNVIYGGVRDGCAYDDGLCSDGTVGCIFGQGIEDLTGTKFHSDSYINIVLNRFGGGYKLDDPRVKECMKIQEKQDEGKPWGKCIE